jgi:hypothetical protein
LDMQLGAIRELVEEGLIGFGKCLFERHPAAAFLFDEGAERRERLPPRSGPSAVFPPDGIQSHDHINLCRNSISVYYQAYRTAVWDARQNFLGHPRF